MRVPSPTRIDLFYIALPLSAALGAAGVASPTALEFFSRMLTDTVFRALDWFFLASVSGFVVLSLWLCFGRFGSVTLGAPDDEPEFTLGSWLAMLFAAGMGVGLLFWGVAEPINHFADPPTGEGLTPRSAREAMVFTNFHWGLHAWAVYCMSGMVVAYFGFRRKKPTLAGTPIRYTFTGRWVNPVAWLADLIAVVAVAFGIAGSTATGIMQMQAGLHFIAGTPLVSSTIAMAILGLLMVTYMTSTATGLDQGIKWLSNLNMALAVFLVVFLLLGGPTAFLLRSFLTGLTDYTSGLVSLSLQLFPYEESGGWFETWTMTNFVWWIAWAPFVGVFIARISRGRTIRSFVLGVLFVPTVFSMLWFAVLGGTALYEEMFGAGGMVQLVREDVTAALFSLLDRLVAPTLLKVLGSILIFVFLVTSLNSATFVLGMLTSQGDNNPPMARQLAWGVGIGVLGAAFVLTGNVHAVRAVTIAGAIPFILILLLQVTALLRTLNDGEGRSGDQSARSDV